MPDISFFQYARTWNRSRMRILYNLDKLLWIIYIAAILLTCRDYVWGPLWVINWNIFWNALIWIFKTGRNLLRFFWAGIRYFKIFIKKRVFSISKFFRAELELKGLTTAQLSEVFIFNLPSFSVNFYLKMLLQKIGHKSF